MSSFEWWSFPDLRVLWALRRNCEDMSMTCGTRVTNHFYRAVIACVLLLCWAATAQRANAQILTKGLAVPFWL